MPRGSRYAMRDELMAAALRLSGGDAAKAAAWLERQSVKAEPGSRPVGGAEGQKSMAVALLKEQAEGGWPKLSESLPFERSLIVCQACGAPDKFIERWLEHDERDKPTPVVVCLCRECGAELIDPHPRLYKRLEFGEPAPGAMPVCQSCVHAEGLTCSSPLLKSKGGPGLRVSSFPHKAMTHVDFIDDSGRRSATWLRSYAKDPECSGREVTT